MTLPLNSRLSALYDTNGTQKEFSFGFRVFFDPDNGGYGLEVRRQTAGGYEIIPKSDYLVLPVEDNSAGVVRFSVAPSAGQQIYIAGKTPTIQQLVLTNFGRYSAESIETQFDFITAIIQEWLSALGEETRQRIAADEILTQYVVQRIDDFVQQVNQNWDDKLQEWDDKLQEIEDYIAAIMPSFTQTLREEIEAFAVAGMQDAIDQTLADSKAEIDDAVARANAAATAAAITVKLYDTPEAGVDPVTGVADGDYFNVRSPNDESYVDEYQNIGGSAVATGKSYPTSAEITYVKELAEDSIVENKQYVDTSVAENKQYVDTSVAENKQYVNSALSDLSTTANKFYPTLAEANYYSTTMAVNDVVTIGEEANKGLWYKATANATTLTKSAYDPFQQFQNFANSNQLFKPAVLAANSDLNNLEFEGFFLVNAQASTIQNLPIAGLGFGFQSTDNLGNKTQWWFNLPTSNYSFRTKWNGEWKAWRSSVDTTQVTLPQNQKVGSQTLMSYKDQGIYNFAASATILDLPSDAVSGVSYTMKVEDYLSGGRFKMQILKCDSGTKSGQMWERTLDAQNNTAGSWRFYSRLHDAQVMPEHLSQSVRYRGSYTNAKISDYVADGLYTFVAATDAPSGVSNSTGFIEIQNLLNGAFIIQTWTTADYPDEIMRRQISSAGIKDWERLAAEKALILPESQKTGAQTLASYEKQGIYNFSAAATISDLPTDAPSGVSYTLRVEDYLSGGRFKMQRLRCDNGTKSGQKWERSLDAQNHTTGAWVFESGLHDAQVTAASLNKSFRYKGVYANSTISDYKDDGLYTFTTPLDAPVAASGTAGLVDVQNWSNSSFVIQTWTTANKADDVFVRLVRPSSVGEWSRLGGSSSSNPFKDKKIVCFGDSITEFGSYPQQLGTRLGATGYNVGFGGCRWGKHANALYDEMCMYKVADYIATDNLAGLMDAAIALRDSPQADDNTEQVARLQSLDLNTVDYVTIFFGTNDFQGLNPIGTDDDVTGETVKGAINLSLDKLLTKYPNLKILLVTPVWRSRQVSGDGLESDANPNSLGLYLRDYVEAIKDMGKKYHVPVLDLYNTSGINKYTKELYLSSDGLHPNSAGYTHLANLIAAFMSAHF